MSLPDSPVEEELGYDLIDNNQPVSILRPVLGLDDLCKQTKFTRQEIRVMYRGFKQVSVGGSIVMDFFFTHQKVDCPEGVVHETAFKDIYAKFFPHGNSTNYAHYVFKAFDINCNGAISFKDLLTTLSTLLRGSVYEKLRWAFKLYDLNGDGCITRAELEKIVFSVHELMGKKCQGVADRRTKNHIDTVFRKLDLNQDGVITVEEFIESCLKDELIIKSIQVFDWRL